MAEDVVLAEVTSAEDTESVELCAALLADHLRAGGASPDKKSIKTILLTALETCACSRAFLLRDGSGEALGVCFANLCCGIESGGGYLWINEMYIKPAHRSRGVGKIALGLMADWAKQQGCRRVVGWTSADNEVSQRLYASAGFDQRKVLALDMRLV